MIVHLIILFFGVLLLRNNFFYALFFSLSKDLGIILYLIRDIKIKDSKVTFILYYSGTLIIIYSVFAVLYDIQFVNIFGFKWDFIAVLEYVVFGLLFFTILKSKLNNAFKSFVYSFILVTILGLIYELPLSYTNMRIYYHYSYPFFIHPVWVLLGILIYKKLQIKTTPKKYEDIEEIITDSIEFVPIFALIVFFFFFYVFKTARISIFTYALYPLNKIIFRIPTFLVFLTITLRMKVKKI